MFTAHCETENDTRGHPSKLEASHPSKILQLNCKVDLAPLARLPTESGSTCKELAEMEMKMEMEMKLKESEAEENARTHSGSNSHDAAETAVPASVLEDTDSEGEVAVLCLGLFALSLGIATPILSVPSTPLPQVATSPAASNMADRFPSLEDFSEGMASTMPCSVLHILHCFQLILSSHKVKPSQGAMVTATTTWTARA